MMKSFGICTAGSDGVKTQKLTLLAMLASLATVGRILFSSLFYLPNVQPVTTLVIICGMWLGPIEGVILAVLSTVLSNLVLGMGIWTLPQILSWVVIGLLSGILGKFKHRIPLWAMATFSCIMGYVYGVSIDIPYAMISGHFWAYMLSSLPFNTYHAVGNFIFMLILYPILSRLFIRYLHQRSLYSNTTLQKANHYES